MIDFIFLNTCFIFQYTSYFSQYTFLFILAEHVSYFSQNNFSNTRINFPRRVSIFTATCFLISCHFYVNKLDLLPFSKVMSTRFSSDIFVNSPLSVFVIVSRYLEGPDTSTIPLHRPSCYIECPVTSSNDKNLLNFYPYFGVTLHRVHYSI